MPAAIDLAAYLAQGGYRLLRECQRARAMSNRSSRRWRTRPARPRRRGLPAGRKWRIVRGEAAPRPDGREHRRRRTRHLQGPPLPRARSAPLPRGLLIAAWAVGVDKVYVYLRDEYHGCRALLERELAACVPIRRWRACRDRTAPRRRCPTSAARVRDDRVDRGQARRTASAPALRGAQVGLFGRPTLEHNFETLYWVRDIVERGPQWFNGQRPPRPQGLRSFSVSGRVKRAGRQAGAGRDHGARTGRRILRRPAGRPRALCLPPAAPRAASCPASMATSH